MEKEKEKHFVLVHGSCHGAWCWYKVATLLKSAGHKVTALDLAASGIHPMQAYELRSQADYLEPLMGFMASLPSDERVILVGHSSGGIAISVAMEKFPEKVSVAVCAAAIMPSPNLTVPSIFEELRRRVDSYMDCQYTFDEGTNKPPTSLLFGSNFLSSNLYQLSPPEDLALALSLLRPFRLQHKEAMLNETAVTAEKYGSVPRVYIVCDQDKLIKEDLQRWMIHNSPPDEVKVISGSDHMLMFSKPAEMFSCLREIAEKYA